MSTLGDYTDFNIRWEGHPKYDPKSLVQKDLIEVLVQKLEMILLTNKSEILGQEGFNIGANLEYYLWQTKLSNINLKQKVDEQIMRYAPELIAIGYDLKLDLFEGYYQDMLQLNFVIQGYNVTFVFGA